MKFFVQSSVAPPAKTKESAKIALFVAVIYVALAVSQLFTFEKFGPLVTSFGVPGGEPVGQLIVSILVVLEVAALPFLLRMRLGQLSRIISMVSGWVTVGVLFTSQILLNMYAPGASSNGLLGATITVPVGWWSVALAAALGVLVAWAAWGLWPRRKSVTVASAATSLHTSSTRKR